MAEKKAKNKPMTDKQSYRVKNEYLAENYSEVTPMEFYREMFPLGSFERRGHLEDAKANGILTVIEGDKARNYVVFDDLREIVGQKGAEFAIMSPIGYSGRNRTAKNARWLYGIAIDLDGVEYQNLRDLFFQAKNGFFPQPTYTVNSGHGLHLYYLFERPVPLYPHLHDKLRSFKYALTDLVWNRYTSTYTEREQVQYQGIFQGFRVVGTQSKLGKRYPVKVFRTGEKTTVEQLNSYLAEDKRMTGFHYQSDLTLSQAKEKYPEWYERRIERGEGRGRWHVNRALYDWWIKKIEESASPGHRYHCLSVLAAYAVKCDVAEDELLSDAMRLLPILDARSDDDHNRLTRRDVLDAMHLYQESYVNFSRSEAERVSGISMPPNKRNGRKQEVHLRGARAIQQINDEADGTNWREGNGRPSAYEKVNAWRIANSMGRKADCIRDTGLSKPTVYKWWDWEAVEAQRLKEEGEGYLWTESEIMANPGFVEECCRRGIRLNVVSDDEYEVLMMERYLQEKPWKKRKS